jgi:hypothetical protein
MKTHFALLAIALFSLFASTTAQAVDTLHHGALNVPANRIVGLWLTEGGTRPCGTAIPLTQIRNTILFQAGGTVIANPQQAPAAGISNLPGAPGFNQRGQDLGTWSFNPLTHQYAVKLRFDWYVDGLYHGYQVVERTILLSNDGKRGFGPVRSARYRADGSLMGAVCGEVTSTRQ